MGTGGNGKDRLLHGQEKTVRFTWLDWLLLTAIVGLSAYLLVQLLGPAIEAWQHRPRPGMQVEQQYIVQIGSDASAVATPINYLLYLPPDYTWRSKWPLVVYLHGSGSRGYDLNLVRREGPARVGRARQEVPLYPSFAPMPTTFRVEPRSCRRLGRTYQ